jgi:hypothetical protein
LGRIPPFQPKRIWKLVAGESDLALGVMAGVGFAALDRLFQRKPTI